MPRVSAEPTLEDIRREGAQLLSDVDEIIASARTDGRILNAEEESEIERLQKEAADLEAVYADRVRSKVWQTHEENNASLRDRFNAHPAPQNVVTRTSPIRAREMWLDDPKKGYKSHKDFLMDVMKAAMTGMESNQLRYLKLRSAAGSDEQSTFSDPYGGYLVPIGFSPTMLQVAAESDPIMGRTTQVPMNVPMLSIPARVDKNHTNSVSGGLRVYRRAEADTVAASRMEMEAVTLRANALMGVSYATEELLTDSPMSFVAILQAGFQDEFDSRIMEERLNGTGVGEMLGIMKSPALESVTRESTGDITYADILGMMSHAWGYRNAIWLANHDTIPSLGTLNLQVGAGGSAIFVQNAAVDMPSTLMGKPLFFSEYMQTLGTLGDILCVNWSQYLEATYQPLHSAESIHVRFVNNERAFRFTMRNDGAPWWRASLTPKHSTNKLSPYVALAA